VVVVGLIINWILWIFLLILFARMILSWVPVLVRDWEPRGPMLVFAEIIYSITDPPLRLLRKVLKPVRIGNMMLDLGLHRPRNPGQHLDAGQPQFVLLNFVASRLIRLL
jgi:YggT family protein